MYMENYYFIFSSTQVSKSLDCLFCPTHCPESKGIQFTITHCGNKTTIPLLNTKSQGQHVWRSEVWSCIFNQEQMELLIMFYVMTVTNPWDMQEDCEAFVNYLLRVRNKHTNMWHLVLHILSCAFIHTRCSSPVLSTLRFKYFLVGDTVDKMYYQYLT